MTVKWLPSYAPVDEEFGNVSLLLHGDGTNGSTTIVNSSSNVQSVTAIGDAQINTTVTDAFGRTGVGVIEFDGVGDYLTTPNDNSYQFGSGNFTVEWWWKTTGTQFHFIELENQVLGNWAVAVFNSFFYWQSYYNQANIIGPVPCSSILNGQWHHIALSRSGTSLRLFFDGALQGASPYTDNTNYIGTGDLTVGKGVLGDFNGYIDDLRITKGVARYTSNFTPPTAPFPDLSPSGRVTIEDDSLDVDARQYIINVEEQDGQPLESGVRTAINDFVVGCKSDGIWNAIKASCILAGARTLDGALVPLVGGAPTNFNFTAVDYDRKTGLIGNSSNKSLDTNRSVTEDPILNCHISAYYGAGSGVALGSTGGDNNGSGATVLNINPLGGRLRNNTYTVSSISVVAPSFCGFNRGATNNLTFEARGGGQSQTLSATISSFVGSGNLYTHRFSGVGFDSYSNARLSFYSIGESLPDGPTKTGLELLDERVSNLITAIGAAIL